MQQQEPYDIEKKQMHEILQKNWPKKAPKGATALTDVRI